MSNKGHSYPNPDPKHPISKRLERVRTRFGIKSKRAFHRALKEGWDDPVSYEALRNYHYDREPPPSYLARVAEAFDIRLAYLVAGDGPMTEGEIGTEHRAAVRPELLRLRWMDSCPPVVRAALVDHLTERNAARWREGEGLSLDREGAEEVWERILEPLDGRPLDWPAFKEYALAAIHALNLALRIQTVEEESDG